MTLEEPTVNLKIGENQLSVLQGNTLVEFFCA